ncbi:MAG: 6,7-dimethyl-8-ribityllumazine synthase [Myxococcales bacterium]|nr:6,7-dimethyl-8-ribityllumazine synthase [Myxococcales bacterium]
MNLIEGHLVDSGGRIGIVAGRFNELVVERLLAGCLDGLRRHGVDTDERVDVAWVPGAMELPVVCQRMAKSGRYVAVIALGAVIRGATPHFDLVVSAAATGCSRVALDAGLPVIFGVLTTETIEQALERAGTKAGNNGFKAAQAAIEMASLMRKLEA